MLGNYLDAPDEYERRLIDRHPLTQRLNRELLECFMRNWHSKEDLQGVDNHKAPKKDTR